MTAEHDDGLTDEERAALELDDGDSGEAGATGDAEDNAGGDAGDEGAQAKGEEGAGDAAGDGSDGKTQESSEAGAAEKTTVETTTAESAPILVVQPPADAEAKLAEIATAKSALVSKFDDGDITAKEYQAELDKLNKQERDIELDIREANLAQKIEVQRQANEWKSTVDGFIRENPRYDPEKAPSMYKLLDLEVRRVATTDEFKNRTDSAAGREILAKAHENLAKELGFAPAKTEEKKTAPPAGKKPETVPSLHSTPASDVNDTSGGKYAVLDRLAATDPIRYEEELMKLSDSERNAYLATA